MRNLDPSVVDALKRRAARNERSLEGELRVLLSRIASEDAEDKRPPFRLHLSKGSNGKPWRREDWYGPDDR